MDKFRNRHDVLLPIQVAEWWHETATILGIESHLNTKVELLDGQKAHCVTTVCTNKDRKEAWELFLVDHQEIKEKFPIITLGG